MCGVPHSLLPQFGKVGIFIQIQFSKHASKCHWEVENYMWRNIAFLKYIWHFKLKNDHSVSWISCILNCWGILVAGNGMCWRFQNRWPAGTWPTCCYTCPWRWRRGDYSGQGLAGSISGSQTDRNSSQKLVWVCYGVPWLVHSKYSFTCHYCFPNEFILDLGGFEFSAAFPVGAHKQAGFLPCFVRGLGRQQEACPVAWRLFQGDPDNVPVAVSVNMEN